MRNEIFHVLCKGHIWVATDVLRIAYCVLRIATSIFRITCCVLRIASVVDYHINSTQMTQIDVIGVF